MTDAEVPTDGQRPTDAQTAGDADAPAADFGALSAEDFANLMASATDDQIAEGINGPARKQVLDEIFKRMADHVDPEKVKGQDAVVHWKILDRPDGGYDHYEVVLRQGTCTVTDQPSEEPRVTLKMPPVEFLKLVSGKESGPALFMTGRLKLEGDLLFAGQMAAFFRIPRAVGQQPGGPQAAAGEAGT